MMEHEEQKNGLTFQKEAGSNFYHGGCRHLLASNSDGAGTGRVEVWCVLCGAQEIYYDDTGTVLYSELDPTFNCGRYTGVIHSLDELNASILNRHDCARYADDWNECMVCGKKLGTLAPKEPDPPKAASTEKLYIVEKRKRKFVICGFAERKSAEENGLRHLTVIIVPFVADGPEKGRWIVHDRTAKLWAKGKSGERTPSLNLFGGHCTADEEQKERIGQPVTMDIFDTAAERELQEELLCHGSGRTLEHWASKEGPSGTTEAAQYAHAALIPIGIVTCSEQNNREASFLYALPVYSNDLDALVAADNYIRQGEERDIELPILRRSEAELKELHNHNPAVEVCDAITRLWKRENRAAYRKLMRVIRRAGNRANARSMQP